MVSHEHRFIFIHIVKCAGTSIEKYFGHHDEYEGWNMQDHRTIRDLERPLSVAAFRSRENLRLVARRSLKRNPTPNPRNGRTVTAQQFRDYYKWTVVRDPWHRVRSWYMGLARDARMLKDGERLPDFDRFVQEQAGTRELRPVHHWLTRFDGSLAMDRIVHFDALDEGLQQVAEDLGLTPIQLGHELNSTAMKTPKPQFTQRTIDRISEVYAAEIRDFGFAPPQVGA